MTEKTINQFRGLRNDPQHLTLTLSHFIRERSYSSLVLLLFFDIMNLLQPKTKALVSAFICAALIVLYCILSPTPQEEKLREHVAERILHHEPGFKKDPRQLSDVYIPRGKPLDSASKKKLKEKWGHWSFVDPKADQRPTEELYAKYPYRDVPGDAFPSTAWQRDPEYLAAFLPEAKALVTRALEAILAEYGHGPDDEPGKSFEERSRMFSISFVEEKLPREGGNNGGFTTEKSFNGLARRILHAIMTEDSFVLAMGGHSSAAGHGNAFQQAYTPQFQRTVEPVFSRLGVQSLARSIAYGGMGTLQTSFGSGDILGSDLDMLVWDSG